MTEKNISEQENSYDTQPQPWDIDRFTQWLSLGVRRYILEDAGLAAFPYAEGFLASSSSLEEGLSFFADRLNETERDNFKLSVGKALAELEPYERYFPVAEQLLAIGIEIRAYSVLRNLSKIIRMFLEGEINDQSRRLFNMALYTAVRLSTPGSDDARSCLIELIGSTCFTPAHASAALLALATVDAERLPVYLKLLYEPLQEQFRKYDIQPDLLARQLYEIVGLEQYVVTLLELGMLDPDDLIKEEESWLPSLLFNSREPDLAALRTVGMPEHTATKESATKSPAVEAKGLSATCLSGSSEEAGGQKIRVANDFMQAFPNSRLLYSDDHWKQEKKSKVPLGKKISQSSNTFQDAAA